MASSMQQRPEYRIGALRFSLAQIPVGGLKIRFEEDADSLEMKEEDLYSMFNKPVTGWLEAYKTGSKCQIKAEFATEIAVDCDVCGEGLLRPLEGAISCFLMPEEQFSEHDPNREDEGFGSFDGKTVDLRPAVREELILQIPLKTCCDSCQSLAPAAQPSEIESLGTAFNKALK